MPAKPQVTTRLMKMLAAANGQLWNASQIGQSMGLTYHTINAYVDYLEGAFLLRSLPPYHANLTKRLVKAPKLYWRDSGLLHAVLNVRDEGALLQQPWVGASWEGYVIEQILVTLQQMDIRADAFHFRTSDQYEIDLVLDFGEELWAIEIKLTSSPSPGEMVRLNTAADFISAKKRILLSQAAKPVVSERQISCNLEWLLGNLARLRAKKASI